MPLHECLHRLWRGTTLERDGYTLKGDSDFYLNPRPDYGLGLLKCSEFTRERPCVNAHIDYHQPAQFDFQRYEKVRPGTNESNR